MIFAAVVLLCWNIALAQSVDITEVGPSLDSEYKSARWELESGFYLNIYNISYSIYNGHKYNFAEEQQMELFYPLWDFLGIVEENKNEHEYPKYSGDINYVEAKTNSVVTVSVPDYDYNGEGIRVKSIVLKGISLCDKDSYCKVDYPNDYEIPIDLIWDNLVSGEPFAVEVVFEQPVNAWSPSSMTYLLDTKILSVEIRESMLQGEAEEKEHNEKADFIRAGIVFSAKATYFLCFLCLAVIIYIYLNKAFFYSRAKELFIGVCGAIFYYPKKFMFWSKSKINLKKSILTKSDGFTKLSISEELVRWSQLKDSNIISEEEFNKVKEKLLETLRNNDAKK